MAAPVFTDLQDAASILVNGGVGIIRTDTLYGVVARADNEAAVERIFQVKGRTPTKSPIVLIASNDQLFDSYDTSVYDYLQKQWPGPRSIILPSTKAPAWLQRGNNSVAYRLPDYPGLCQLIATTGPLIAPSANPEGDPPAMTIDEAVAYFGDNVDFYVDSGTVKNTNPSELWQYTPEAGTSERLR